MGSFIAFASGLVACGLLVSSDVCPLVFLGLSPFGRVRIVWRLVLRLFSFNLPYRQSILIIATAMNTPAPSKTTGASQVPMNVESMMTSGMNTSKATAKSAPPSTAISTKKIKPNKPARKRLPKTL